MKGSIAAPANVMKIRGVEVNVAGNGSMSYSGAVGLSAGEQWMPTMVATYGSTHAGYVDSYEPYTGTFTAWFTTAVPEGTTIKVWGFAYKTE